MATRDLAQLVGAGLLVAQGEKRGRYYVAGQWLHEVRAATRLTKMIGDPFTGDEIREEPTPYAHMPEVHS